MKILIVDDDLLIRNWLSLLLRQIQNYDISLFEASDGVEALELCAKEDIELVITDIKMPRLDGIGLITRLKESYPNIRCAVLSSYDEFDYVRLALKSGALDYILKAEMKIEDISQLLEKTVKDFHLEEKQNAHEVGSINRIKEYQKIYNHYLGMKSNISSEELLLQMDKRLSPSKMTITLFAVTSGQGFTALEVCDIALKTYESLNINAVSFPGENQCHIILSNYSSSIKEEQDINFQKSMTLLSNNLLKYMDVRMSYSINIQSTETDSLIQRISDAMNLMETGIYYGKGNGVGIQEPAIDFKRSTIIRNLRVSFEKGDNEEAVSILLESIQNAHRQNTCPSKIKSVLSSVLNLFITNEVIIKADNQAINEILDSKIRKVLDSQNEVELSESLRKFCKEFLSISNSVTIGVSISIKKALDYIDRNYMNKMTLDDVSNHVYLNSSYLSQLFKKEMGISFGEYLESIRLKHAKDLIKNSNKPMSDIAEEVGFSSQNYFNRVFKKATSLSPAKYKEKH